MKKLIVAALLFILSGSAYAIPPVPPSMPLYQADCTSVIQQGVFCMNSSTKVLYMGDGSTAQVVTGSSGTFTGGTVTGSTTFSDTVEMDSSLSFGGLGKFIMPAGTSPDTTAYSLYYNTNTYAITVGTGSGTYIFVPLAGTLTTNGVVYGASSKTLASTGAIGNSKVICTTSGGVPTACTNLTDAEYQAALTYPVTGVAAPTAGYLTKWGASGNTIADAVKLGTMTNNYWCQYTTAGGIACDQATPGGLSSSLTSGYIFVGNGSNVATGVAMSGDVTIANTGATTIGSKKVLQGMINDKAVDAGQLADAIARGDGTLIDLSGITQSNSADEGITLPTWASVTPTSDKPFLAWDAATPALRVYKAGTGWYTFSAGGSGAPTNSAYLLVGSHDANLSGDRLAAATSPITISDGGAKGNLTFAFDPTGFTGNKTWAAGGAATITWTWDVSTGTDPSITFGNDSITLNNSVTMADAKNFSFNTSTGTKIGTATGQKIGFFNATPVAQQTGNIVTALSNLGLVTSGTINDLTFGSDAQGDIAVRGASAYGRLAKGSSGAVLTGDGTDTKWSTYILSGTTGQTYTFPTTSKTVAASDASNLAVGSDARGDILIRGASAYGRLGIGTSGSILTNNGTDPAWSTYFFSGTAAATYTLPGASATLQSTTGTPAGFVIASQAQGDLLYASSATAWARLGQSTQYKFLITNGASANPSWSAYTMPASIAQGDLVYGSGTNAVSALTKSSTANSFLKNSGTSNNPAWATIALDDLSDAAITSAAQGDILYHNGTNWVNLVAGDSGKFLKTQGAGANPTWDTPSGAGDVTSVGDCTSGACNDETSDGGTYLGLYSASGAIRLRNNAGVMEARTAADAGYAAFRSAALTATAITADSVTLNKSSGTAGDLGLYEANSTDTDAAGFRGPSSITANNSYRGQFPNSKAASDNSVLAWASTATGTGSPSDPYIQAMSWIIPLQLTGGTMTGKLITSTPASPGTAGLNLPHGAAPGTLADGDVWTTTGGLYARINGSTVGPYTTAATLIDDTAYNESTWNGVTGVGPSKNVVRDYLETLAPSGIVSPAKGGTGVANNASSTLTISGNYATTLTVSNTTSVTLPTSGTLAILGANTFTGNQTFGAGATALTLSAGETGVTHGITTVTGTNNWLHINEGTDDKGGAVIHGLSDGSDQSGLSLRGYMVADPDDGYAAVGIRGYAASGTGVTALGATKTVFQVYNNTTSMIQVLGNGNTTIAGTTKTTGAVSPATAGGTTAGTAALPFSSLYIGDAATNNIQITGTASASAKVATFPNRTGTVAIGTANSSTTWGTAATSGKVVISDGTDWTASSWTIATPTTGGIAYGTGTGAYTPLAKGTANQILQMNSGATAPEWTSAPQPSTIELGHASDTTLSRSAAGVLAVEGKDVAFKDGSNWTISGQAIGDIPVASSTTAYGKLAAVATGQVLVSAGTGTAPAWSATPTVTSLYATGVVDGTAYTSIVQTSAGVTISSTTSKGGYYITNPTADAAAFAFTLPTAAAGLQYCLLNGAAKTGAMTVTSSASGQYIDLDGVLTASGGHIQSAGAAGDMVCLVGVDSTHWKAIPTKGTWTKD